MWRSKYFHVVCIHVWGVGEIQGSPTPVGAFPDNHERPTSEGKLRDLRALLPSLGSVTAQVPFWRFGVLVVTIFAFGVGCLQFGCHGRLFVGHLLHEDHYFLLLFLSHLLNQPQVGNVHMAAIARG